MSDHDIEGHFEHLKRLILADEWRGIWDELKFQFESFGTLGVAFDASDEIVWTRCQERNVVLVTGNRNADGEESLEVVIRRLGNLTSLPVVTLADPDRVSNDRAYADRVVERLFDYLIDIENVRGTGRLYLP
ncbi:MAG TPA: hypothetical protein VML55_00755 [Planctomycetaceae bacterium]|nr:hypothetical protein [Planctomycetaceae bacterium]